MSEEKIRGMVFSGIAEIVKLKRGKLGVKELFSKLRGIYMVMRDYQVEFQPLRYYSLQEYDVMIKGGAEILKIQNKEMEYLTGKISAEKIIERLPGKFNFKTVEEYLTSIPEIFPELIKTSEEIISVKSQKSNKVVLSFKSSKFVHFLEGFLIECGKLSGFPVECKTVKKGNTTEFVCEVLG